MSTASKPLRVDAQRNRIRVLDAADAAFAERGLRAGIEEIAERAGVGVGTVCRNFGTKEALIAEVLAARCEELLGDVREAVTDPDPGTAFRRLVFRMAEVTARYRALAEEMAARGELPVRADLKVELHSAFADVIRRAQEAGAVRQDVSESDVMLALAGIAHATVAAGVDRPAQQRFVQIILDGLRPHLAP